MGNKRGNSLTRLAKLLVVLTALLGAGCLRNPYFKTRLSETRQVDLSIEFGDKTFLKSWAKKYAKEYGGTGGVRSTKATFYRLAYELLSMYAQDEGRGSPVWHQFQELKTVNLIEEPKRAERIFEIVFGGIDPKLGRGSSIHDKLYRISEKVKYDRRIYNNPYVLCMWCANDILNLTLRRLEVPEIRDLDKYIEFSFRSTGEVFLAEEDKVRDYKLTDTAVADLIRSDSPFAVRIDPRTPMYPEKMWKQFAQYHRTVPVEGDTLKVRSLHVAVPYRDSDTLDFSNKVGVTAYWDGMGEDFMPQNGKLPVTLEALVTPVGSTDTVLYRKVDTVFDVPTVDSAQVIEMNLPLKNIHTIEKDVSTERTSQYKVATRIAHNGKSTTNASFFEFPNDMSLIPTWDMYRITSDGEHYIIDNKVHKGETIHLHVPVSGSYPLPWPDKWGNRVYSYAIFFTVEPEDKPKGYKPRVEIGEIQVHWTSPEQEEKEPEVFTYESIEIKNCIGESVYLKSLLPTGLVKATVELPKDIRRGRYLLKGVGLSYDYESRQARQVFAGRWRFIVVGR